MKQTRLSYTRIAYDSDYLASPRLRALKSAFHIFQLRIAADEFDQSSPRRRFQPGSERTHFDDFIGDD